MLSSVEATTLEPAISSDQPAVETTTTMSPPIAEPTTTTSMPAVEVATTNSTIPRSACSINYGSTVHLVAILMLAYAVTKSV